MLNISNKILYEVDDVDHDMLAKEISEDDLREIFFSSKLKLWLFDDFFWIIIKKSYLIQENDRNSITTTIIGRLIAL